MQMQRSELRDTRAVMNASARQQKKQARLVRKQNLIAELEIHVSIKLVELEALQTERIGVMNRIITQSKPTADHFMYGDEKGKNYTLPEVVQVLDRKIEAIKHELEIARDQIKKINQISSMEKMIENFEDMHGM